MKIFPLTKLVPYGYHKCADLPLPTPCVSLYSLCNCRADVLL